MNKTKKFVVTLLSVLMVLSFMPAMSFAAEKATGGHEYDDDPLEYLYYVDADAEGLEVIIPPTCTTDGIGVISCDEELNGVPCGFTRTVWINATRHTAGETERIGAVDLMKHIGYTSTQIDTFFHGPQSSYSYCQCYVYVCKDCGEYVDANGRVINAVWSNNNPGGNPPAPIVYPPSGINGDRVTEHTKPETPNCQKYYTCSVCGYEKCDNDEYSADYHDPSKETPADKKLTITYDNVHQGATGKYVRITKWTCGLCNETGIEFPELVGYLDWDEVTHPNTRDEVVLDPTCDDPGLVLTICKDCGMPVADKPIQKLGHDFKDVTPYNYLTNYKYTDGTYVDPTTLDFERYTYTAKICTRCGGVQKDSIKEAGYAPAPAAADISFAEFTKATCEQGSWIVVTVKNGELIRKYYYDDLDIEYYMTPAGGNLIEKVGDKYYTKGFWGTDKVEVPYTPALNHDFGAVEKVAEATCEEAALEGRKCTKCGKVDHNDKIHAVGSPLGHEVKTEVVAPTCGTAGYSYDTCTRCKMFIDKDTKKATDDIEKAIYDEVPPVVALGAECDFQWTVTKAPTSTEDGEEALVCTKCGAIKEGSQTVVPKDSDKAKDIAISLAKPIIAQAANIISDTANYKASSIAAIKEAKDILNAAIGSGNAADVNRAAEALDALVKAAEKKDTNPMTAKAKTVKASSKKKMTFKKAKAFTVKKAQGTVTFKKSSGNKKITVSKAGKVTVKKGLKKGKTYKVKVKVTAAGNGNYLKKTKTVTLKVKVTK